jgi:hypothetical protein
VFDVTLLKVYIPSRRSLANRSLLQPYTRKILANAKVHLQSIVLGVT